MKSLRSIRRGDSDRAPHRESLPSTPAVRRAPAEPPVIWLRQATKTYLLGDVQVRALRGVSLRIQRGEFVAIVGSSGSGKSTMMHLMGCLDVPSSGRYLIDGTDVGELEEDELSDLRNRKIGFVFQSFNLIPRTSALANVELPLAYAGLSRAERERRAKAALAAIGMADRLAHMPSELSGGQQQRVALARAVVTNPALLLADEPTGNLDSRSTEDVLDIFEGLHEAGRTIVLVTHEPEVAARAGRVIRLSDGEIAEDSARALAEPRAARPRQASHPGRGDGVRA